MSQKISNGESGQRVTCRAGLDSVDLPIGKKIEKDGASFALSEQGSGLSQASVTLDIKLGAAGVPAIIVRDEYGTNGNEGGVFFDGKPVNVAMAPGASAHYVLTTGSYSNATTSPIVMVTMCVDTSNTASPISPAPSH